MNRITIVLLLTFVISSADVISQWSQTGSIPQGGGVTDMVVMDDGTLIVTTGSYNWPGGQQGGIRRSTDDGNSWHNVLNGYNARTLFLGPSGRMFASCWLYPQNEGMFFSSNGGVNWTQTFFGAANDNVFSIAAKNGDSMVFIGTRNGVYRNFNNGSWIQLMTGMPVNSWVRDISISANGTILAATTNGVFRSTNHGNQWSAAGSGISSADTIISISKFAHDGTVFCASSSGKAYKTNVSSFIWTNVFSSRSEIISDIDIAQIASDSYRIFIAKNQDAFDNIKYSADGGNTWTGITIGLTTPSPVSAMAFGMIDYDNSEATNLKMYAGLYLNSLNGAPIYKTDFNVGINNVSAEIPDGFSLSQNFPNPFNPVTTIEFAVPKSSFVKIVVYDLLGKELEAIVNQHLNAGTYRTEWNGSNYNSGVYFYKLTADNFSETKKMNLVK